MAALPAIKLQSVPSSGVIKLYERTEVTPDTNVIYLYAVPSTGVIKLHNGVEASGGGSVNATGAWTAGNDTWSGAAKETLTSTGAWTAGNDIWVGVGTPGTVVTSDVLPPPVALRPLIKLPPPQFGSQSAPVALLSHITRNLKGQ